MRKWERNVARYRLGLVGYDKLNTKRWGEKGKPLPSAFALLWRNILTPGTPLQKKYLDRERRLHPQMKKEGVGWNRKRPTLNGC